MIIFLFKSVPKQRSDVGIISFSRRKIKMVHAPITENGNLPLIIQRIQRNKETIVMRKNGNIFVEILFVEIF